MVGFSFSIVTSWTALSGVLIIGVESGGPPVMIWGWLGVCLVTLAVAYSMAEMCSAYVVSRHCVWESLADLGVDIPLLAGSIAGWLFWRRRALPEDSVTFMAGSC